MTRLPCVGSLIVGKLVAVVNNGVFRCSFPVCYVSASGLPSRIRSTRTTTLVIPTSGVYWAPFDRPATSQICEVCADWLSGASVGLLGIVIPSLAANGAIYHSI